MNIGTFFSLSDREKRTIPCQKKISNYFHMSVLIGNRVAGVSWESLVSLFKYNLDFIWLSQILKICLLHLENACIVIMKEDFLFSSFILISSGSFAVVWPLLFSKESL